MLLKFYLKKAAKIPSCVRWLHSSGTCCQKPIYDTKYITARENCDEIKTNIELRKHTGSNLDLIYLLQDQIASPKLADSEKSQLNEQLQKELRKIPNRTHHDVKDYGDEPKIVKLVNPKPTDKIEFSDIAKKFNLFRTDHLANFAGHKSYYLMNELAELEQALIRYTLKHLTDHKFELMTVPDILPAEVIESCGMTVDGHRNQVYKVKDSNLCLSGTSEMALAGYFAEKSLKHLTLPKKVTAVSRCFRAETSGLQEEKGIYRVHQFTKVEMFAICQPQDSESVLNEFLDIQIKLFEQLGIHFKVLDMPPFELGAPAYRKYDIETWMPGRKIWGEISSSSNCTDYQARRLNITCLDANGHSTHCHTVNGTACAVPRMLIALTETFQNADEGCIHIPKPLQKYMMGKTTITRSKKLPEVKLVKHIINQ